MPNEDFWCFCLTFRMTWFSELLKIHWKNEGYLNEFVDFIAMHISVSKTSRRGRDRFSCQFVGRVVYNLPPIQWFENCIFSKSELLALDVWQKWKISHSRSRGVAKVSFGIPTLHGDQKKKWSPRSMGMSKVIFATPLEREWWFEKWSFFCCCEILWIWEGEKVAQMWDPWIIWNFVKKI